MVMYTVASVKYEHRKLLINFRSRFFVISNNIYEFQTYFTTESQIPSNEEGIRNVKDEKIYDRPFK